MVMFTASDGAQIHYADRAGSGDVLVLVHGYAGSMSDWDETMPRLPADWRIVRVDLRGAGNSGHAESGYAIERYAQDVFELVTQLSLPPFVLVGHSMGGAIAAQFTIEHQDVLRGTILLAPAPLNGIAPLDPALMEQIEQLRGNVPLMKQMAQVGFTRPLTDAQVERSVHASLKVSTGHRRHSLDAMVGLRLGERLGSIKIPVLIAGGDRDNLVPVQTMLESFGRIPNCGLQIFQRVGHMVQQEVPDEFASLVQDFVQHTAKKAAVAG